MPFKNIQDFVDTATWENLGSGSYNAAFKSKQVMTVGQYTGPWVLKKPHKMNSEATSALNHVDRAIRKWNLHNPEYPAHKTTEGWWLVPYLGNTPASDQQISDKIIEIYQQTRHIITDACGRHNFLIYQNKVVCIDVDFSLRRGSIASDNWLDDASIFTFMDYLDEWSSVKPQTTSTIRALLYLEKYLAPAQIKNEYITPQIMKILHVLYTQNVWLNVGIVEILLKLPTLDMIRGAEHACINMELITQHFHQQLTDLTYVQQIKSQDFLVMLQLIVLHNADLIYSTGEHGYTLMDAIVHLEHHEALDYLINQGIDVHLLATPVIHGQTHLIHLAAQSGQTTLVQKLIALDNRLPHALDAANQTPLCKASLAGHHKMVALLAIHQHETQAHPKKVKPYDHWHTAFPHQLWSLFKPPNPMTEGQNTQNKPNAELRMLDL